MRPVIGITCGEDISSGRVFLPQAYIESVKEAGGIPLLLPPVFCADYAPILKRIEGLLLSGGVDVDPVYFNEEPLPALGEITPGRDQFEVSFVRQLLKRDLPILAICRGIQVLNIAAGGSVMQDIPSQIKDSIKHSQDAPRSYPTHKVNLISGTKLYQIYERLSIRVNSFHHQAVKHPGSGFIATAWAADGVIEAIESEKHSFVVGVQWHPECMVRTDGETRKLFSTFVEACTRINKNEGNPPHNGIIL